MNKIKVSIWLLGLIVISVLPAMGVEEAIDSRILGRWGFVYKGQQRTYEFKDDKTFTGGYAVSGDPYGGTWRVDHSTVVLVRAGETKDFATVGFKQTGEAELVSGKYSMTGQKSGAATDPATTAQASPAPPTTDENKPMAGETEHTAPGETSDEEHMDGAVQLGEKNVKVVFPKLELSTNDQGHPVPQTIRLNDKVIEKNGRRYSGFWFVVDRSGAAQKQGFSGGKGNMELYLYFLPPKAMDTWGMEAVNGEIGGEWSFRTLKLWRFRQGLRNAPPKDKDRIIVQTMGARRLKEGKEYYMQFGFPLDNKEPTDMTICLGYRKPVKNYNQWKGFDEVLGFLGLEHKGKVGKDDMFGRKK